MWNNVTKGGAAQQFATCGTVQQKGGAAHGMAWQREAQCYGLRHGNGRRILLPGAVLEFERGDVGTDRCNVSYFGCNLSHFVGITYIATSVLYYSSPI